MSGASRPIRGQPTSPNTRLTAKRTHRKSRTGCLNCKARRVKCDEVKPLCGPCSRHYSGLNSCDYEDSSTPSEQSSRRQSQVKAASLTPISHQSTTPPTRVVPLHPFETLPNPPVSYSQDDLLPYYRAYLVFRLFPFFSSASLVEAWWQILNRDTLLTQIAMATTALQLERKLGRKELYHSTELTYGCVRLLQERLEDAALAVSDDTLVAVSQLIALENDTGNVKTVRLHSQALNNMVNLRGGLDLVSRSSNMAAALLFWNTMVTSSEPSRLPFRFEMSNHSAPWTRSLNPTQLELTGFGIDRSLAELLADVSDLYTQLRNVSTISDPQTGFAVVLELCRILQSLVTFESRNPSNFSLTEAVRQAAILYLFHSAQDLYPVPTLFADTVVHGLKTSISHSLGYFQPEQDGSLLSWTAYIGSVVSGHLPEHRWFVDHLAFLLDNGGVRTKADFDEKLANVVAFGTLNEFAAAQIWKEVEDHISEL